MEAPRICRACPPIHTFMGAKLSRKLLAPASGCWGGLGVAARVQGGAGVVLRGHGDLPAPNHVLTWHRPSPAALPRTRCPSPSAERAAPRPWWAACHPQPLPPTHRTARTVGQGTQGRGPSGSTLCQGTSSEPLQEQALHPPSMLTGEARERRTRGIQPVSDKQT